MEWRGDGAVRWLEADLPGGRAAFSTRSAGSVKESHAQLAAALGLSADRIAMGKQAHGAELAIHKTQRSGVEAAVDGHVVCLPGMAAMVYVADCLPVALGGPGGVAILHCGWRGLAAGIVARGAEAVGATHAAIGPGIGPCCYEVGDDVLSQFPADGPMTSAIPTSSARRRLDLVGVARGLLAEAGVGEVESAGLCTRCEGELFFSHRREASRSGRQAGLVWLDPGEA